MKELTKSEEQMMDIFWDSKEALTSVDTVSYTHLTLPTTPYV